MKRKICLLSSLVMVAIILFCSLKMDGLAVSYPSADFDYHEDIGGAQFVKGNSYNIKLAIHSGGFQYEKYYLEIYYYGNSYDGTRQLVASTNGWINQAIGYKYVNVNCNTTNYSVGLYKAEVYACYFQNGEWRKGPYSNGTRKFSVVNAGEETNVIQSSEPARVENLIQDANGNWIYYLNGQPDMTYTGLTQYAGKWWYVKDGVVNFTTTLCEYAGNWWYVENGAVNLDYVGYVNYGGRTYKVAAGVVIF